MNYRIISVLAFCLCATAIFAQKTQKWAAGFHVFHQDQGFKIDVGQLAVTDRVRVRPGFSAGLERTWTESKNARFRLFQDVHAGFWHNPYSENYSFLGTRLGMDFRIFKQLRLSPGLIYRAGRAKTRDVRYVYENEKWVPSNNSTPAFFRQNAGLDMQVSWRFRAASAHPISLEIGGNYLLAWKYLPTGIAGEPNFFLFRSLRAGVRYGF